MEVPVPVQPAGETAFHERLGIGVEVPLGKPWGKPFGNISVEETSAVFASIDLGEVNVSGPEPEDSSHGVDRISVEFFFSFARFLEVEDVVKAISGVCFEHVDEAHFYWWHVGDGHGGDPVEKVGSELGERPGDHGSPVVADNSCWSSPVMADESGDISGEVKNVVIGDVFRGVTGCISSHVGCDDFVACLGDGGDLVTP